MEEENKDLLLSRGVFEAYMPMFADSPKRKRIKDYKAFLAGYVSLFEGNSPRGIAGNYHPHTRPSALLF